MIVQDLKAIVSDGWSIGCLYREALTIRPIQVIPEAGEEDAFIRLGYIWDCMDFEGGGCGGSIHLEGGTEVTNPKRLCFDRLSKLHNKVALGAGERPTITKSIVITQSNTMGLFMLPKETKVLEPVLGWGTVGLGGESDDWYGSTCFISPID